MAGELLAPFLPILPPRLFTYRRIMMRIILLLSLITYSFFSFSAIVNIHVSGNIIAMPCTLVNNNYSVDLKKNNIWYIGADNSFPWVDFSIQLINCPLATKKITMTINGTSDTNNSDYFLNTGTSTNSALHLVQTSDKTLIIKNGTQVDIPIDSSRNALLPLSARITGLGNNMTAGTFLSHIEFTLSYN